jgi:hypothetical protein
LSAVGAAGKPVATPGEVTSGQNINHLWRQTSLSVPIEHKRLSGSLANHVSPKAEAEAEALGEAGRAIYEAIVVCSDPDQLDSVGRLLWKGLAEGSISDGEATYLSSCLEQRRPLGRRTAPGHATPLGKLGGRLASRFTTRQRQRSPDRKASRDRRRMLGGSSALPDTLRHHYTEGQRAVLCIIAGEVKKHGICDLPNEKIAALAGVCLTTVQTTGHEARRMGHISISERPQRGRKSLTNIVQITSPEWRVWIRRRQSPAR